MTSSAAHPTPPSDDSSEERPDGTPAATTSRESNGSAEGGAERAADGAGFPDGGPDSPEGSISTETGSQSGDGHARSAPEPPAGIEHGREFEVKLAADRNFVVPDLTAVRGIARVGEPVVHDLDATYYDTADLDLMQARMTLRRREGGKDAGWHLKLPSSGPGWGWAGGGGRTEIRFPLADDLPEHLALLTRAVARGSLIEPVMHIRTRRTVVDLIDAEGTPIVEVADDDVRTELIGEPGVPVPPVGATAWRELEVELLAGHEDAVRLVVGRLTKAGARPAAGPSKLGAALAAAGRRPRRQVDIPQATRRSRAPEVVLAGISRYRDALLGAGVGMRQGDHAAVHACRSAVRRLRAALTVFEPLFEDVAIERLLKNLRLMDKMLRPIRDNDILLARLTSEIAEEPPIFASQAEALVRRALAERNAEAWDHIRLWQERKQSIRLLRRLDDFLADPPLVSRQHGTAARLLPAMVAAAWGRTRKLADAVSANPDDAVALDRLRRGVKAVRYSSELAGAALGDDPVVFAAAVEDVQEALGEHRNALLVGEFLVNLAGDPRTSGKAGFLYGRLHAIADSNVLGAIDDFADAWDRANDAELTSWLR